jgi:glucose/arabinose dehydrogenase
MQKAPRPRISRRLIVAVGAALFIAASGPVPADAKPKLKLKRIGRFHNPVYATSAPGVGGIFVVEQGGRIRHVQGKRRRTFLKISGLVRSGGERGLLSVAFSPDSASSRLLSVYFTNRAGDIEIAELRADPDGLHAATSTLRPVLIVPHPGHSNHNGGQLQFGPDGLLYAGTGDGGGSGDAPDNAQDPNSLLGKLIQIDPTAPASPTTIYARGLRNPYRFSFDLVSEPAQPRIAIADVGEDRFEEIDYLGFAAANGANFGWNDFEGFAPFEGAHPPTASPTVKPIKAYPLKGRACAIVGGYVVRDRRLRSLFHRYVYGDFCAGWVRSLIPDPGGARKDRNAGVRVPQLSSFGEAADGSLYATSLNGPVYRLVRRR